MTVALVATVVLPAHDAAAGTSYVARRPVPRAPAPRAAAARAGRDLLQPGLLHADGRRPVRAADLRHHGHRLDVLRLGRAARVHLGRRRAAAAAACSAPCRRCTAMLALFASTWPRWRSSPRTRPSIATCIIVAGAFLGVINTLVTEAVMGAAPVERPVASAAYSFVRFTGGAIGPYVALKLAEHVGIHAPFWFGAIAVAVGVVIVTAGTADHPPRAARRGSDGALPRRGARPSWSATWPNGPARRWSSRPCRGAPGACRPRAARPSRAACRGRRGSRRPGGSPARTSARTG